MVFLCFSECCHGNMRNLNVIVVLEFISRDLCLLFAILLFSKFLNLFFYHHMRPKSGLKFPRPFVSDSETGFKYHIHVCTLHKDILHILMYIHVYTCAYYICPLLRETILVGLIPQTCPCNVYLLEPKFYMAKLGYAGVYLFIAWASF